MGVTHIWLQSTVVSQDSIYRYSTLNSCIRAGIRYGAIFCHCARRRDLFYKRATRTMITKFLKLFDFIFFWANYFNYTTRVKINTAMPKNQLYWVYFVLFSASYYKQEKLTMELRITLYCNTTFNYKNTSWKNLFYPLSLRKHLSTINTTHYTLLHNTTHYTLHNTTHYTLHNTSHLNNPPPPLMVNTHFPPPILPSLLPPHPRYGSLSCHDREREAEWRHKAMYSRTHVFHTLQINYLSKYQ